MTSALIPEIGYLIKKRSIQSVHLFTVCPQSKWDHLFYANGLNMIEIMQINWVISCYMAVIERLWYWLCSLIPEIGYSLEKGLYRVYTNIRVQWCIHSVNGIMSVYLMDELLFKLKMHHHAFWLVRICYYFRREHYIRQLVLKVCVYNVDCTCKAYVY